MEHETELAPVRGAVCHCIGHFAAELLVLVISDGAMQHLLYELGLHKGTSARSSGADAQVRSTCKLCLLASWAEPYMTSVGGALDELEFALVAEATAACARR
eukprot:1639721-Pleurochrysis_carterae.AAC.2